MPNPSNITRTHVIPVEGREAIHCAQLSCWCCPRFSEADPATMLHHAATNATAWVLIGELDPEQ